MNRRQRNIWFVVTVAFAVCLSWAMFKYFFTYPGHCVGELGTDGSKNTFTYLYECMHGNGVWFAGMNYPYGEHIVYTDGQPLISVPFAYFHHLTASQALAVDWWLIILGYIISVCVLFRILIRYRVRPISALLFAGLITVCTPQILRIQGHYALAFVCIIPLTFYWFMRYHDTLRIKYPVFVFIAGVCFSFIHLYYMAMILIWVLGYTAGVLLGVRGNILDKLRKLSPIWVSIVAVFGVVSIIMKLTDPIKDRPLSPYNSFFDTCTHLRQIVSFANSPLWQFAQYKHWVNNPSTGGEGFVYAGVVVLLTLFISVIVLIVRKARRQPVLQSPDSFSPVWLVCAAVALCIGMGIPFIWRPDWMEHFAAFRQFRSLGRFSWIYYNIAGVYAAVVIDRLSAGLMYNKKRFAGVALLVLVCCVWGTEAGGYMYYSRYRSEYAMYNYSMVFSEGEQGWDAFLNEHHYQKEDLQAILAVPFYHVGTEKLWVAENEWLGTLTTKAALQLGLPIVDVLMSRSSWAEAMKQVRIAGGPFTDKPLLRDIHSKKPFLLLYFNEDSLVTDPDQRYLFEASDKIGFHGQCMAYAFYPERLVANDARCADSVRRILPYVHQTDTCINGGGGWFVDHFDNGSGGFIGSGAKSCINTSRAEVASIPVDPLYEGQRFEFSTWFLLDRKDYKSPDMVLRAYDSAGRLTDTIYIHTSKSVDNSGMWFRMSKYFRISKEARSIKCILINDVGDSYLKMDEMMLRPADALILSRSPNGDVMADNHIFGK
jgi:hypothetical protein